jgi:DNA polymerase III alpha subunit
MTKGFRQSAQKLRDFYSRFVKGASGRGVNPEVIEEVWQMILGFEGYSFCKPHSAIYTLVAYKSAYLRAHYPAEFMAAVIIPKEQITSLQKPSLPRRRESRSVSKPWITAPVPDLIQEA